MDCADRGILAHKLTNRSLNKLDETKDSNTVMDYYCYEFESLLATDVFLLFSRMTDDKQHTMWSLFRSKFMISRQKRRQFDYDMFCT